MQILSTICFSFLVALTQIGVGHHAEYFTYVRPDMLGEFYKIMWYYSWILVIAYSSIKISIACFLLRLVDHSRSWRWFLHAMIGEFTRQQRGLALIFDYISHANLVYNRICSFFVTTMQPCGSSLGLQLATAQ